MQSGETETPSLPPLGDSANGADSADLLDASWELESNLSSPCNANAPATDSQMLQRRDLLLDVTAQATNVLLTVENLPQAINTALGIIGEGVDCDLVSVLENVYEPTLPLPVQYNFLYEWAAAGLLPVSTTFGSSYLPAELISSDLVERLRAGDSFGGPLAVWDEPLRSTLASVQIQAAYIVPIRVNGQWWGVVGLDYCRAPVQVSSAEIAVLRTIADCIGSAIQRDRDRQERERVAQHRAAELEEYNQRLLRRDQLLEATARATKVLVTLDNIDDAINTALKILLDGIGCDRINILENGYEPSSPYPVSNTTIYEWVSPYFEPSAITIGRTQAAAIDVQFLEHFLGNDGYGGFLEVWPEPLRSAFAAVNIQAAYSVPIRVNGHWWGILCFDYCRAAIAISPAEVAVVRTVADSIGSAIERDRTQKMLLQAEQAKVAELAKANYALKQSLDALAVDPDLDRLIGTILRLIAQQLDAPRVDYGPHDPAAAWQPQLIYWQGALRGTADLADTPADGLAPFLSILLTVGDTTLGALTVYLPSPRAFSQETMELAHALAQQLTLAVELTRLAAEAQQAALLQERTHMAREIHDTLAQSFCSILMQLQVSSYLLETQPEQAQTHLRAAQTQAKDGLDAARRSVWTLYLESQEYEDPSHTIAKFIEQVSLGQSVPITLAIDGAPYRLNPDVGLNLLRIAQEAIANALRHAQPRSICLGLSYGPQSLRLTVQDDGCGFDPQLPSRGFGLLGMQERAARIGGRWHLTSQAGRGTAIAVTLTDLSPSSPPSASVTSAPPQELP